MPRPIPRCHKHEPVEQARDLNSLSDKLVPQFKAAAVLRLPAGSYVIEKVQYPIIPLLAIVRVVDMWIEKVPPLHRTQATGVEMWIANSVSNTCDLRDLSDHSLVLKRKRDIADQLVESGERFRRIFP